MTLFHRLLYPSSSQLRKLTYLLVFLTFDLILFGAFTRLTDSGLGCPDWPGCYANFSPIGAAHPIELAQSVMPTGPVTAAKAWVEMLHRYFATSVGILIILCLIWSVRLKKPVTLPILTLLWVCLQGAFGAFTVTMKLFPAIVTLHLLGGLVLLMLLQWQAVQQDVELDKVQSLATYKDANHTQQLKLWLAIALVAVWLQIALGGWVSTNYAVLACNQFPTCLNGEWLPVTMDDWHAGFMIWRDLGMTTANASAELISFSAMTAIHLTHRFFAAIALIAIAGLIWKLKPYPSARTLKRWLMSILTLQIITGISNVVLGWPLLTAVMHTGGSAALVLVLTRLWVLTKNKSASVKIAI